MRLAAQQSVWKPSPARSWKGKAGQWTGEDEGVAPGRRKRDHQESQVATTELPRVHAQVLEHVLKLTAEKQLVRGTTVAVDATLLEASAAMKTIVRRDTGEDWKARLRRLVQDEGLIDNDDQPTDEDLRRFDRQRKGKTVSNEEWVSPADPESRIAQMKDGSTPTRLQGRTCGRHHDRT